MKVSAELSNSDRRRHDRLGTDVVVYGTWGCGMCWHCAQGMENYCSRAAELGIRPPGLGAPGALAEYMIVDSVRHLVPIGDLNPTTAVPLTDAGLTPYHAIKRSMAKLRAGSTAVVTGSGGLGHIAIQLLRHLSPARVVALDVSQTKLDSPVRVAHTKPCCRTPTQPVMFGRSLVRLGRRSSSTPWACSRLSTFRWKSPVSAPTSCRQCRNGQAAAHVGFFRAYETNVAVPCWERVTG
jgi:propanol-preferring alcohol dehydrogenase